MKYPIYKITALERSIEGAFLPMTSYRTNHPNINSIWLSGGLGFNDNQRHLSFNLVFKDGSREEFSRTVEYSDSEEIILVMWNQAEQFLNSNDSGSLKPLEL